MEKENELCTFNPKLNSEYRVETETAQNIILNSNSYLNHVERVRKGITAKSKDRIRPMPGSGCLWKNQLTSPKKHVMYSDKDCKSSSSLNVKSLKKVILD